jgi:hypothetical protein
MENWNVVVGNVYCPYREVDRNSGEYICTLMNDCGETTQCHENYCPRRIR